MTKYFFDITNRFRMHDELKFTEFSRVSRFVTIKFYKTVFKQLSKSDQQNLDECMISRAIHNWKIKVKLADKVIFLPLNCLEYHDYQYLVDNIHALHNEILMGYDIRKLIRRS